MKRHLWTLLAAGLIAASPALAAQMGAPPAYPILPWVTDAAIFGGNIENNACSSMCLDCHSRAPLGTTQGTHFVAAADGQTYSGGTGIDSAYALVTRDDASYFGLAQWPADTGTYLGAWSKYCDGAAGVSYVADNTANPSATAEAAGAAYAPRELLCESCHNILANHEGGNNLLAAQTTWTDGAEAGLCVGCHGFMYTTNAANAGSNYGDARNDHPYSAGVRRDNNEYHSAWNPGSGAQEPYAQNHHVMTGDVVNSTVAGAGLLWTDNLIVSYTRNPFDNTTQPGSSYPAPAPGWTLPAPTNAAWMNCTNCHAPAHGGAPDEGASILRDVAGAGLGGNATNPWDRILERGGFKRFNDDAFCSQCHQ